MHRTAIIPFLISLVYPLVCASQPDRFPVFSSPSPHSTSPVIYNNFLGISFELSFINQYLGNDTTSIPPAVVNYLSALRQRTESKHPVRLRIGGNSMDSSTYVPDQQSPMIQFTNTQATANESNHPVNFGPTLFNVLKKVSSDIGGAQYLLGLSLLAPNSTNSPLLAGAAQQVLSGNIDSFAFGNELDLYLSHQKRPGFQNYTVDDYIADFKIASALLNSTSAGDILSEANMAGPSLCCGWDLATLLNEGFLSSFSDILKYITLQHYPQNNCDGPLQFGLSYYTQHANVVSLAAWQQPGINIALSSNTSGSLEVLMTEFNSASCGGILDVSDTFAVGSLWTADYVLQMATVGYSGVYLHTREQGNSYNIIDPPASRNGAFTAKPAYYSLLSMAEILQSSSGSVVTDLNLQNSISNSSATMAGYAVRDAQSYSVNRVVLFNYANTSSASASFTLPASMFQKGRKDAVTVKYLSAVSLNEKALIAWGGETVSDAQDGKLAPAPSNSASWAVPNKQLNCNGGCTVTVPGPAMAVVFVNGNLTIAGSSAISPSKNMAQAVHTFLGQGMFSHVAIFAGYLFSHHIFLGFFLEL